MNRYTFDLGNSTEGPVGFTASVYAADRTAALRALRDVLDQFSEEITVLDNEAADVDVRRIGGLAQLTVYFNGRAILLTDVSEEVQV